MKGRFLIFIFLFSGIRLFAQDSLTIEQAVATALKNNYDIRLARNDSEIAAIGYAYRNAAFLPQVNATGTLLLNNNSQSQTFTGDIVKTRSGIKTGNTAAGINLNWTIFNGFKMFIGRTLLGQMLESGSLAAKNQVVNTVSDIIKTYYDIVRQKQQLRNIEEQMALVEDQLKLAQYKFQIGAGIKPDVLQAQIDFNQQKAAQLNQLTSIEQRKQALNLIMNVGPSIQYEVSDTIPVDMDLNLGDLMNNLTQTSPALLLSQQNVDIAKTQIRLAKSNLFPTVGFTAAYNFSRINNNAVVNPNFQPLLSINKGFNYGITASIPIFDQFAVRQQIKVAQVNANFQQLNYEKQSLTVTDSLLNAFKTYETQKKIVAISDSSIAWARENLNISRERYRLGATTFIELRQAEQNLEQTQTTLITARYNLKVAETELRRLKGDLLKP